MLTGSPLDHLWITKATSLRLSSLFSPPLVYTAVGLFCVSVERDISMPASANIRVPPKPARRNNTDVVWGGSQHPGVQRLARKISHGVFAVEHVMYVSHTILWKHENPTTIKHYMSELWKNHGMYARLSASAGWRRSREQEERTPCLCGVRGGPGCVCVHDVLYRTPYIRNISHHTALKIRGENPAPETPCRFIVIGNFRLLFVLAFIQMLDKSGGAWIVLSNAFAPPVPQKTTHETP